MQEAINFRLLLGFGHRTDVTRARSHGLFVNDNPAHKFDSVDCTRATKQGRECEVFAVADYEGGSVVCTSTGDYQVSPAQQKPWGPKVVVSVGTSVGKGVWREA